MHYFANRCSDFELLRADAHKDAIFAAGALPVLVAALASSTSEATQEPCAGVIRNFASSGAWCCLRQRTVDPGV